MKKLSFALTALAALTSGSVMAQAANTADGTVEIRGKVVDQTCEVATTHKNLVVILDTVGTSKLDKAAKVAGVKPFTIKLNNCAAATADVSTVYASFSTASLTDITDVDDNNKGVLKNKATDNAATNVGIQLLNADGSPVDLNSETTQTSLGAGAGTEYAATDAEVVFGVVTGQTGDYTTAKRTAADANTAAANVLGKKVAGGETWVAGTALTNNGAKVEEGAVALEYKAQYIATEGAATAGEVEAFVSYNIAYK